MNPDIASEERKFRLTPEEKSSWDENGYFVRHGVFTKEENNFLAQIADDIAIGKRLFPEYHIFQNALVRDGKIKEQGIYAMHNIQYVSCNCPEFLARTRDPRLTDPAVDILGPDILGLNNLYIWKPPKIGLGFPWHQDKWYFKQAEGARDEESVAVEVPAGAVIWFNSQVLHKSTDNHSSF